MPTTFSAKIKRQGQQHVEDGEHVLAGFIVAPNGWGMARQGPLPIFWDAGERKVTLVRSAAKVAGLPLPTSRMALALTDRRVVVLSITRPKLGWPWGIGANVKAVFSAVAVDEVDSITVKRWRLFGTIVTVTLHRVPIELETSPRRYAEEMVREFERLKAKHWQ